MACLGVRYCLLQLLLLHCRLVLLRCHLRALAAVGELHVRQVCLHLRTDREQEGDASTYMAHTSILAG
jgi:hypothetical protein